ncbi:chemotaxis protein CheW [Methyloferula stellata]|uniref:chemotaxis protein CheW n=1 Tax=Methyloferula stellata TaxID=876270 RepID=UPI00037A2916|nr:chemotaxis protein CheW [Methyloferula stellata]
MKSAGAHHFGSADSHEGILPGDETRCFTVIVGGETFGLPVEAVQTIFRIDEVTPIPLGPEEILGLVNLRGKIVTAVSLRRRLRMKEEKPARGLLAIGIEHRSESFALVVDEVGDVIVLDPKSRIPLPPHLDPQSISLTNAVYRIETEILPILDMASVFDFQRRGGSNEQSFDK